MGKATHLVSDLEKIKKTLKGKFVYLFLDYDGTLAPIAETPDKATMPKETKDLLQQLSNMPNCKIAIVSGRALKDVSRRIDLKNIVYVGNHGFEIKGPKIDFKSQLPYLYRKTLEKIKGKLEKNLSLIRGVLIEDKGFSLSVHYRSADKKAIPSIMSEFYTSLLLHEVRNDVLVKTGKMTLEIMPPIAWDKGKVVLWLLARRKFVLRAKKIKVLPIYIGDDITDEDAFISLQGRGITVFVGKPKKTKARFYVKDSFEAAIFLKSILEILSGRNYGKSNKR